LLNRASVILKQLEEKSPSKQETSNEVNESEGQLTFFVDSNEPVKKTEPIDSTESAILNELKALNLLELTPLEEMNIIYKLQSKLKYLERITFLKIHQLPESLANKIAAGEVVERPASVVKELVENSLDVKSTMIKVEVIEAGLHWIKVSHNGAGMSKEEVERSFLRHATSKIQYDTDLFHVNSLGFRGEALASISAVSKLTIKTSTGDEAGTELYLEGGKIIEASKSDARQGTEIT